MRFLTVLVAAAIFALTGATQAQSHYYHRPVSRHAATRHNVRSYYHARARLAHDRPGSSRYYHDLHRARTAQRRIVRARHR